MLQVRPFITSVSRYLVDQEDGYEFTHWEETADLLVYFRNALGLLALVAKPYFQHFKEVPIEGSPVLLPDGCIELHDVVGVVSPDGSKRALRKSSLAASRLINRPVCGTPARSYQYDPTSPNILHLDGDVEPGAVLQIVCYGVPDLTGAEDEAVKLPRTLEPVLFELMLYYAYGRDVEAGPFRERSQTHLKTAIDLLKLDASIPAGRVALLEKKVG